MLGITSLSPKMIGYGIVLFIILSIGFTFYKLTNDLDKANLKVSGLESALVNSKLKVTALENGNKDLSDRLTKLGNEYRDFKLTAKAADEKYRDWLTRSDKEKFSKVTKKVNPTNIDLTTATCREGIELNKSIAELKYEDL